MAGWILKSTDPEMTLRLPEGSIRTVGRSARAEFIVEAALVSRLHCRLTAAAGAPLLVEDLESTNGIFVNGQKVDRAAVQTVDLIGLRHTLFVDEHHPPQRLAGGHVLRDLDLQGIGQAHAKYSRRTRP